MKKSLVSIIILNWNGLEHLEICLPSVVGQTYENIEVVVVDNGSTDDSIEYVKENYDSVKLICNSDNVGFAEGNNVGIRGASGEYIVVLNNDTEVDENWISAFVKVAEEHPDAGMLACKILSYYDRKQIDCVGHLIYPDGLSRGRGRGEIDEGQYDKVEEVAFPSGCAALYRREMLEQIGLFDKDFFIYVEDSDLGIRGRLAGWKCFYVPDAVVYHKYSATMGGYSPKKAIMIERNRIWFVVKNLPPAMIVSSFYYAFLRYLFQAYDAAFGSGAARKLVSEVSKWTVVSVLFKAYWSALVGIPGMLKKRREIRGQKQVTSKEIRRWYRDYRLGVREIALKA
ncbi:glycosyltransferase family 2 protein [Candidatus Poribacteria bacterium]